MSEEKAHIVPDALSEMLERNKNGAAPETSFELIHHPKTPELIVRALVKRSPTGVYVDLLIGRMNLASLHNTLKRGGSFQGRDHESAEMEVHNMPVRPLQAYMRKCFKDLPDDHPLRSLSENIREKTKDLIEGFLPMTLEEVKLFEERTGGLPQYTEYRDFVAPEGKKPMYNRLKGFDQISLIIHNDTANSVWINLVLAAIDQDDHDNLSHFLADAPVGDKMRDVHRILHFILVDPVLAVSPEILSVLLNQYNNSPNYCAVAGDFAQKILKTPLPQYDSVIGQLAQQSMLQIKTPRSTSCFMDIFQFGTEEMIAEILQTQEMINSAREHIAEKLSDAFLFLTQIDGYKNPGQAELLKSLAQINRWEVTFPE